jgi:hypothetical protein
MKTLAESLSEKGGRIEAGSPGAPDAPAWGFRKGKPTEGPGKGRGRRLSWFRRRVGACPWPRAWRNSMALDDKSRTELEAAVFRRLVEHLRKRTDVQNIDLMNLAGFCRNCLSNWMKEEADKTGVAIGRDESREAVYGMPYDEWKAKYQREASSDQKAAFDKSHKH